MICIICFACPAFLAVEIWEKKLNKILPIKEYVYAYVLFFGLINFLNIFTVSFVFKHTDYILENELLYIGFIFKYLLLGFIVATILPDVFEKLGRLTRKFENLLEKWK